MHQLPKTGFRLLVAVLCLGLWEAAFQIHLLSLDHLWIAFAYL